MRGSKGAREHILRRHTDCLALAAPLPTAPHLHPQSLTLALSPAAPHLPVPRRHPDGDLGIIDEGNERTLHHIPAIHVTQMLRYHGETHTRTCKALTQH